MKLWEKGYEPDSVIERFTVGKDPELDLFLLPFDIEGSMAHAAVLQEAGLLTQSEKDDIDRELKAILELHQNGEFSIPTEDEDCHTAIEKFLTLRLGDVGKKIHTGRSRNDQVLTALRLYQKAKLTDVKKLVLDFQEVLKNFSDEHHLVPMPGYTHTRRAMPHSVSQWAESFGESLEDDLTLVNAALKIVDKNPLGTGAGYGVSLPLNRELSKDLLSFGDLIQQPMYAQNSRGKTESAVLFSAVAVLSTLNRWASDLILFTAPEFGFFTLENRMTTGSSIMPHKKNPDVLELIRASVHQVSSNMTQVQHTAFNLMSGYHRDLQLTKEPLMNGLETVLQVLRVSVLVMAGLQVNKDKLSQAMTDDLFSVDKVYELVRKGIPFREAYKIVAGELFGGH